MLNWYIIRETARVTIFQPPILCVIILQLTFIITMIAGVRCEYDEQVLSSVQLFGYELMEGSLFLRLFLPSMIGIVCSAFMFLFILGTSSLIPTMLCDPLIDVIITRPLSRARLLASTFVGILLAVWTNLLLFGSVLSLVLTAKCEGTLVATPLLGSMWLSAEFFVIAACCSLFALLTESPTGTATLGLAYYFVLGPMIEKIDPSGSIGLTVLSFLIPPVGGGSSGTVQILLGSTTAFHPIVGVFISATIYFVVAVLMFHRRDFR